MIEILLKTGSIGRRSDAAGLSFGRPQLGGESRTIRTVHACSGAPDRYLGVLCSLQSDRAQNRSVQTDVGQFSFGQLIQFVQRGAIDFALAQVFLDLCNHASKTIGEGKCLNAVVRCECHDSYLSRFEFRFLPPSAVRAVGEKEPRSCVVFHNWGFSATAQ